MSQEADGDAARREPEEHGNGAGLRGGDEEEARQRREEEENVREENVRVDVRMIDFAHVFETSHVPPKQRHC